MSEDDPKPGVVIDVEPERDDTSEPAPRNDTPDQDTQATDDQGQPRSQSRLAMILAALALLAVIVALALAYRHWSTLRDDIAAMDARIHAAANEQQRLQQTIDEAASALQTQQGALVEQRDLLANQRVAVDEAKNAFQAQEQKLADENLRLQEREAELRAAVADVHRRVGRSGTQWIVAEVEYLLRIANHRLILARDTGTARIAMEIADQRLRDTEDPGWTGVREQIARDMAALAAFAAPDSAGLSAKLGAMIEQIPQLKIESATIGPERTLPQGEKREPGERNLDTLLDDLWSGFKDTVRVRKHDAPIKAMLPPEQQFFLYENLKLHLVAARLGVARGDQALFENNLRTARDWLNKYFEPDDAAGAAMRQGIDDMLGIELRPALPDVSQSLRALTVRLQLQQSVTPGADPVPAQGEAGQ